MCDLLKPYKTDPIQHAAKSRQPQTLLSVRHRPRVCPFRNIKINGNTSWHSHVSVGFMAPVAPLQPSVCVCVCESIYATASAAAAHVCVTHSAYPVLVAVGSLYTH